MLHVQRFLLDQSVEELAIQFAVTCRRHPVYPHLAMFKYSQLNSPLGEPLVRECRGIILDEAAGWRIVSYPYDKFFNHGEPNAAVIEWATARVYEKLDGSLCVLYWYEGQWRVASSGLPDAGGPVNDRGELGTFAQLFWETWRGLGYGLPAEGRRGCCFMFELMSPVNRVVVQHKAARLVLHGVRDVGTCAEERPEAAAKEHGWEVVASYPLGSMQEVVQAAGSLRPMENEGYVVCDGQFNRLKVKSPLYVALAHTKDNFTPRRMLELIRANEGDEFLAYFPELRPDFERTRGFYERHVAGVMASYERLKGIATQKEFAAEAVKTEHAAALFALRAGKHLTVESFLQAQPMSVLERAVLPRGS